MNNSRQLNLILKLKDEVSGGLGKVQSKMKSMESNFKKMAAVGTVAFLAIGAGIMKTTKDAAKAEGSWNKFNTVFGEGAKDMTEWIEEIRKEMPSATHEIARMSADLQDLLIPMGLSRKASMGMTKEMVNLANKLAAFNDVDPTVVLEAFKSGLSGSSEPLRRFGINALESTLEAHALKKGIGDLKEGFSELDPMVKAQVRAQALISLAYEQSGDAISGFAANNDALLRRQQSLDATFKELSVTIGTVFVPIVDDLVKKLAPIIEKFANWAEENPKLVKGLIIGALAVSALTAALGLLGLMALSMVSIFVLVNFTAILPMIVAIGGIVLAVGALIAIAVVLNKHWQDIWTGMQIVVGEVANAIITIFEGMINFIVNGINVLIRMVNSLLDKLIKIPKIGSKFKNLKIDVVEKVKFERYDTGAIFQKAMDRTDSKTGVDILSDKMSNFITGENTSTLPVTPKNNLQAGKLW